MLITFTTTHSKIPNQIRELEKLGELIALKGRFCGRSVENKILQNTDILLANPKYFGIIDRKVLDLCQNLKYLFLMSSGFDWVDINYAKSKGVIVGNAKGANAISVAEHAWSLALGLAKSIQKVSDLPNIEIHGKTVGIFGYGYVGKMVADIAEGFGTQVFYTSRHKIGDTGKRRFLSKSNLLKKSDILFLCLPLTPDTEKYFSRKEFGNIKKGAILVNTAREDLVDRKSLLKALKTKKIIGYGIDTNKQNSYFLNSDSKLNIISTFHMAYKTGESVKRTYDYTVKSVEDFLKGKITNSL